MKFLAPELYQERVSVLYSQVSNILKLQLPYAKIDHIGSSAIKNAYSKGDLDILVRVDAANFEKSRKIIEQLGYQVKQGNLRTSSLCMLESLDENADVAIQLIASGSEFEFFITFRDILNTTPELVVQYNNLKISSTGLTPEEYRHKKSIFIENILNLRK